MNIEELKLILETVATVTDDAKTVAVWYFVLTYGASFVVHLSALIGVLYSIVTIVHYLVSTNEWAKIGVKLTHAWGSYGNSTYADPNDQSCLKAVDYCLAAAKEHKK